MTREEAHQLLEQYTKGKALLRHAQTVAWVMEAIGQHFGENEDKFYITGLLHDADYEAHPDQHPQVIVNHLRQLGEEEIAHAIAGHYTKWQVPRHSLLDKAIVAADELTGFVYAAALIRPTRLEGMTAKSVLKKLKTKHFAASVDREEVRKGAELLGWELPQLIELIIRTLQPHARELGLVPGLSAR